MNLLDSNHVKEVKQLPGYRDICWWNWNQHIYHVYHALSSCNTWW